MSVTTIRHHELVDDAAKSYRARGYDVVAAPSGDAFGWATDFEPDLLARAEHETVVIAVAARSELRRNSRFTDFAAEMADRPMWRFELVLDDAVANGAGTPPQPLALAALRRRAGKAEGLLAGGQPTLAVLLASSVLEGLSRVAAQRRNVEVAALDSMGVIAMAASLGYLGDDAYTEVYAAWPQRSRIVHGLVAEEDVAVEDVGTTLVGAVRLALAELDADGPQPVE